MDREHHLRNLREATAALSRAEVEWEAHQELEEAESARFWIGDRFGNSSTRNGAQAELEPCVKAEIAAMRKMKVPMEHRRTDANYPYDVASLGQRPLKREDDPFVEDDIYGVGVLDDPRLQEMQRLSNEEAAKRLDDLRNGRQMRQFTTGATRNDDRNALDYEGFLSPLVLKAFAEYMHKNRRQADGNLRASDNWQKGIPRDAYMKSMWRHFMHAWSLHRHGAIDADDLIEALMAVLFNVQGYAHEMLKGHASAQATLKSCMICGRINGCSCDKK